MVKTQTQYGVIKATPLLPIRDLLIVPHKSGDLVVSHPAFGPNTYSDNLAEMQREYIHSNEHSQVSFREPTTSESISVYAYDFENMAKPQILDSRWLQLGRIFKTSEGVFANPPKDAQGNPITDEKVLKSYLKGIEKTNGIYLGENDFGFALHESFQRGIQDCDTFSRSGLARLLEHTEKDVAKNLKEIASPKFYRGGVNVWGFDFVSEPVLRIVNLYSNRGRLDVVSYLINGDGFALGVLNSAERANNF
jgi:hypothetical protein